MNRDVSAFGPREIARAMVRHKKKVVLTFALMMIIVTAIMIVVPKSYHSQGLFLLRLGKENATLDSTVTLGQDVVVAMPLSREEELNSVVEIFKSRAIAEKVVDALTPEYVLGNGQPLAETDEAPGLLKQSVQWARNTANEVAACFRSIQGKPPYSEHERAIESLMTRYSISSSKKTNVITVDCKGPSPAWTQKVVQQLMDVYQVEHCRVNRSDHSVEFFGEQSQRALQDLTVKQEALRDVKNEGGIVARPEQRQAFTAQVARMEDDLQQAHAASSVSESRIAALEGQLKTLPPEQVESVTSGIGNQGTEMVRSQLYQLQVRQEEAAAKYTGAHPNMQAIHNEVEASRNVASNEDDTRTHVVKAPSRLYQETKASLLQEETQLAASRTRESVLGSQLASLRGKMKGMNQQDLQIASLERDIDVCQAAFRRYAAGYEQAKIDQARALQQISNIAVAQAATCELEPVFPTSGTFLGIGAVIAFLSGAGVAVLAEARDRSFREPEDVERRLGVSVLATIPHFAGRQLSTSGQRRV